MSRCLSWGVSNKSQNFWKLTNATDSLFFSSFLFKVFHRFFYVSGSLSFHVLFVSDSLFLRVLFVAAPLFLSFLYPSVPFFLLLIFFQLPSFSAPTSSA